MSRRKIATSTIVAALIVGALAVASSAPAGSLPTMDGTMVSGRVASVERTTKTFPVASTAEDIYCYGKNSTYRAKNAIGNTLWFYRQHLGWCGQLNSAHYWVIVGTTPKCQRTSYKITNVGGVTGWEFIGHVDCQYAGGVGKGFVKRWREGHFRLCPVKVGGCVQNVFPFVWVRGDAIGAFTRGGGTM